MKKKTKIFFDGFPLAVERPSGIGHLIAETIRAFESNQYSKEHFSIAIIVPRGKKHFVDQWGFRYARVIETPIWGRLWSALVLHRLMPPVDILFGKGVYVFGNYTTWPLLFSRTITYIHDLNFLSNPETVRQKVVDVLKLNVPLWIRRADHIATISEFSKTEIIKYYNVAKDKIAVLLCGVDHGLFYPREQSEIDTVKKKYKVNSDYLLFLSNVEPRKNIDRVLDAYLAMPVKHHASVSLLIIGADGWLNDSVHEKINRANSLGINIIWPKSYVPDEDIPAILSGAIALVHPALHEGFGMPPLESMACGTPVIVSNTTSLPEVVGSAGLYIDPFDVATICESMTHLVEDKVARQVFSAKGIKQAELFNWSHSADKLTAIIKSLLE